VSRPEDHRLGPREWFGGHIVVFLIGAWNLFAIDLARTPDTWWFWFPVGGWAAVLGLHALWLRLAAARMHQGSSTAASIRE